MLEAHDEGGERWGWGTSESSSGTFILALTIQDVFLKQHRNGI